jgi:anti-sigma factor RsiW
VACEPWTEQLDTYLDGELPAAEARTLNEHLRGCSSCAAESLRRMQQKLAIKAAGQNFAADSAFRARIQRSLGEKKKRFWQQRWFPVLATAALLLVAGAFFVQSKRSRESQLIGEIADLHVASLASSTPVDVVSTDRHTVKPWFAGRIPFTFNLPELQNSPFTLLGGRVSYLEQSPGAELIYKVRQHQISVFIFQERGNTSRERAATNLGFEVRNWSRNGLRYFIIGDASPKDLDELSELFKNAG